MNYEQWNKEYKPKLTLEQGNTKNKKEKLNFQENINDFIKNTIKTKLYSSQQRANNINKYQNIIMKKYKTNKKENLAMLDVRTGNLIGKITTGTKTTVNPSISNIARLYKSKDNSFILIHNHPENYSFSLTDIKSYVKFKSIDTMIVKSPNYTFYLEAPNRNIKIEDLKQDYDHLERNTIINEDNFSGMILDDKMYNERAKAGERILNLCQKMNAIKGMYIGEYRGFKMYLEFDTFDKVFKVALKNKRTYRATLGNDKVGVITRINNVLETIEKDIEGAKKYLQNLELQLRNAQETLEKPFEQEKELQETMARLKEVNKLLKIGEEDKKSIVYDEEDIEESDCSEKEHITSKEHIR